MDGASELGDEMFEEGEAWIASSLVLMLLGVWWVSVCMCRYVCVCVCIRVYGCIGGGCGGRMVLRDGEGDRETNGGPATYNAAYASRIGLSPLFFWWHHFWLVGMEG
jgi:hypothetical protein